MRPMRCNEGRKKEVWMENEERNSTLGMFVERAVSRSTARALQLAIGRETRLSGVGSEGKAKMKLCGRAGRLGDDEEEQVMILRAS